MNVKAFALVNTTMQGKLGHWHVAQNLEKFDQTLLQADATSCFQCVTKIEQLCCDVKYPKMTQTHTIHTQTDAMKKNSTDSDYVPRQYSSIFYIYPDLTQLNHLVGV